MYKIQVATFQIFEDVNWRLFTSNFILYVYPCRPNLSKFLWKQLHQVQSDREWPEWRDEARPEDQNTSEEWSHYVHPRWPLHHAQGQHINISMGHFSQCHMFRISLDIPFPSIDWRWSPLVPVGLRQHPRHYGYIRQTDKRRPLARCCLGADEELHPPVIGRQLRGEAASSPGPRPPLASGPGFVLFFRGPSENSTERAGRDAEPGAVERPGRARARGPGIEGLAKSPGRLPGMPGLADAERQRAPAAEQEEPVRRDSRAERGQAGLRALPGSMRQPALPQRSRLQQPVLWRSVWMSVG